ncbi:MAG: glycosyltransferase family 2 protein [Acidobacteriota bacterium]|nr:glycosyltransferase family 2 protein [Acidobacteriota bacterium]
MNGLSDLRLLGLAVAVAMVAWVVMARRGRALTRGQLVLGLFIAVALAAFSAYPPAADALTAIVRTETRLMALAIIGVLVLFALFLYLMREVASLRVTIGDLVRALARAEYARTHAEGQSGGVRVIIPAYNEEHSLRQLLPRLPAFVAGQPVSAIVVSDGARDRSVDVARAAAVPVTAHAINRGQGGAIRTGFELAARDGADIVVTMDADGQHQPEEIARLVEPIVRGEADFVMGTRFSDGHVVEDRMRHVGIIGFSRLITLLSGVKISDCTNGFRAIRVSSLAALDLREDRFSAPELLLAAASSGMRMREVPVTVSPRLEGDSKKPGRVGYPFGFWLAMLRAWLRT